MSNSDRFLSSKCTPQLTSIIPACPRTELKQSKLVQQNRSFNRFNISQGSVRSSVRVPKAGETRNSIWKVPWQAPFYVPPCRSALSQTLTRSVGPYCIHDVLIAINKNPFLFILSTQLYCSAICWYFWKINKTAKTEIGLFILFFPPLSHS